MTAVTKRAKKPSANERRVASFGRRDRYSSRAWGGRLPNPDPTIRKFGTRDGVGIYTRVLRQFANVAGYCQAYVDHVLINDPVVKAARAENDADQIVADAAARRAGRAWLQVRNRTIVLQKLLYGRFYGFARAEKVARFDEVINEWIPDLYDVPQEYWLFDDDGREFLVDSLTPGGVEVDPSKFVHFQWGTADTKYGEGALSGAYLALYKIQKLEEMALQRIEDNESVVIVHVPTHIQGDEFEDLKAAYAEEFRKVIMVPAPSEQVVRTETPTIAVTTSGASGRQEYEGARFYERWVQTHLLGAPQTGDKSLGTGKVEETRKDVWNDKTPIGRITLDYTLTQGWMQTYCDWNMPDVPTHLRPHFESDAGEITEGLTGAAATELRLMARDLVANLVTTTVAVEHWTGLGLSKARAQAMADSIVKERSSLATLAEEEKLAA